MASTSILNSKKVSFKIQKKNGERDDGISSLPDNILHHILSFLPTKFAVATSVLSTRWKCLWTATWNLEFSDKLARPINVMDCRNFSNSVDRVLLLHGATSIRKFSLSSRNDLDASRVNAWICSALKRNVEDLSHHINLEQPLVFPRCLFTCESFTKLKLHMSSVFPTSSNIIIPSSVCFPSLKVLHLHDIKISCDDGIQELFFSFPVAEEVVLEDCLWAKVKFVNISTPALKRLIIDDFSSNHDNGEIHYYDCEIKVYAERLTFLDLTTSLSYDLSLYGLSSLYSASIRICTSDDACTYRASKLLKGVSVVTDLTLFDTSIYVFSSMNLLESSLTFPNLKIMTIAVDGGPLCGSDLSRLFSFLPTVEILFFELNVHMFCCIPNTWELETIPQSFLSHLKSIELRNFSAKKDELYIVEFLLRNARSLEIMKIISSITDPKTENNVTKQLLMLPRGSPSGVIQFS